MKSANAIKILKNALRNYDQLQKKIRKLRNYSSKRYYISCVTDEEKKLLNECNSALFEARQKLESTMRIYIGNRVVNEIRWQ